MAIKKYSKVKFTLRKELIIIIAAVVVMIVATILFNLPNKEERFLKSWNEAGSTLTENLLYEEVSFEELEEVIAEDAYVFVLFASSADANSVTVFDTLYSLALNTYELDTVYLVDSEFVLGNDREEDSEFDAELKAIETKFADAEGNTITLDQTPNFWVFRNGKLVAEANQDVIADQANDWSGALIQILNYSKEQ